MRIEDAHSELDSDKFGTLKAQPSEAVRIRPPSGRVKFTGFVRNLSMGSILRRVDPSSKRMSSVDKLAILQNDDVRANYEYASSKLTDLMIGMEYVITSGFRTKAENIDKGGQSTSDHLIGLAFDVAFGDYDATKSAFATIVSRTMTMKCVRQIIFENVRGTTRGYHIHIGFYPPGEEGAVQSAMWYSRKANRGFVQISSINEIPSKGDFEDGSA